MNKPKPSAVTGTASTQATQATDNYRIAAALAGHVGQLKAENYALRADNAHLTYAVHQLMVENESVSRGFEIVLAEVEKRNANG